ncbi:MAG: prepilin-type N-terminal cleavage/methylation domain-containing protein [Desulfobulbus sp.]|nr:prepilin-type N-terminal cleavage/methylation domain-containing protein [Desulfobulbus sp.]
MLLLKRQPCFNEPRQAPGFTLLEVMVAVALIAIALVTLIGAQARSVAIATGSQFDVMASMLAQWKLTELSLQDFRLLGGGSGDFGETYSHYSWKAEVDEVSERESGIKGSGDMLKTIDVTILVDDDPTRTYTARTIVYNNQKSTTDTGQKAKADEARKNETDTAR